MTGEEVRQFFRFIDWMLELPEDLELQFYEEVQDYTKETRMPYISTLERWAMERGREEGLEEGRQEGLEEGREESRKESRKESGQESREEARQEVRCQTDSRLLH